MIDYLAFEIGQFVNTAVFDVFAMIMKIGINATSLVGHFKKDFIGVIGGRSGFCDFEPKQVAASDLRAEFSNCDLLIHSIIFY